MPFSPRTSLTLVAILAILVFCFGTDAIQDRVDVLTATQVASIRQPDLAYAPSWGGSMAVKAAYESIPHRRTTFDFDSAALPEVDQDYLERIFFALDQAVLWRVQSMWRIENASSSTTVEQNGRELLSFIQACTPPPGFRSHHRRIVRALELEIKFLASQTATSLRTALGEGKDNPELQAISSELVQAYHNLARTLPTLTTHNQSAIFDYHCAMDFL